MRDGLKRLLADRNLDIADGFLSRIIKISDFLAGVVWRDGWYQRAIGVAESSDPFATDVGVKQKDFVENSIRRVCHQLQMAFDFYENETGQRLSDKFYEG